MYGGNYFGSIYYGQRYGNVIVGTPTWVSPVNGSTNVLSQDQFVFIIPSTTFSIHFHIQFDTVSTFNSLNLVEYKSHTSQTGWEYYNGSSWVAIPQTGIPTGYAGNQARFTPPVGLSAATWYRRIRGRVVTY